MCVVPLLVCSVSLCVLRWIPIPIPMVDMSQTYSHDGMTYTCTDSITLSLIAPHLTAPHLTPPHRTAPLPPISLIVMSVDSTAVTPVVSSPDPNFTGTWHSTGHVNMEAFLKARGFSEGNANMAAKANIVQKIQHTSDTQRQTEHTHSQTDKQITDDETHQMTRHAQDERTGK